MVEGINCEASAYASHAEGGQTKAQGFYAHAEGSATEAKGANSHAEGNATKAYGGFSHAEGARTEANGQYSHAQNYGTKANAKWQTVIGKWNTPIGNDGDTQQSSWPAFIIGNCSSDNNRSNAFEVDWNGDAKAYGDVYKNGTEELVSASQGSGSDSVSIANSTSFADTGVEAVLDPGLYILIASINFPSGTGRRGLRWYYGSDTNWGESAVSQPAVSGANTRMQVTRILKVSSGVTMKIQAFQNSGSALTCDVNYRYIRLA